MVTASRNFSAVKMSGCWGPQLAMLRKPKDRQNHQDQACASAYDEDPERAGDQLVN